MTPTDRMPMPSSDVERIARGLDGGDRIVLSRAITLIESKRADHRSSAAALMQALLPHTGKAVRVGITGAPGVGKSTLIDALGLDASNLVALLNELEDAGLIVRSRDRADRRRGIIELSAEGERLLLEVDRALSHIYGSGEINAIIERTFGKSLQPESMLQMVYILSGLPD